MGIILQILCKFLGINSDEELGTKVLNVKTSLNLEYILPVNAKVQNISYLNKKPQQNSVSIMMGKNKNLLISYYLTIKKC